MRRFKKIAEILNDAVNSVTGQSNKLQMASIAAFTECQDVSVDTADYYCMNADRIGNFKTSVEDIFRQERTKKVHLTFSMNMSWQH